MAITGLVMGVILIAKSNLVSFARGDRMGYLVCAILLVMLVLR